MIPDTITMKEATARYKVHREAIEKAIRSGHIEAFKPGKQIQLNEEQADRWFLNSKMPAKRTSRGKRR